MPRIDFTRILFEVTQRDNPWWILPYQRSTSSWCFKSFTRSQRSREIEDISPMWRFWLKLKILIGGRTSPKGWPDKSSKPYWNLVRKAGQARCPKLDISVLTGQTTNQKFRYLRIFYKKANTISSTWNKSFQFMHHWTWFNDLTWDKDIHGIWFKNMRFLDLRGISSLMASQQAIKVHNIHEWVDMVTKIEKLQGFWKPHKLTIIDGFSNPRVSFNFNSIFIPKFEKFQ
jgi:hypothetical protein